MLPLNKIKLAKFKQRQKLKEIITGGHKDAHRYLNFTTHRTGSLMGKRKASAKDLAYTAWKFGQIGLANNQVHGLFDYFTVTRDIQKLKKPQWLNLKSNRVESYRIIASPCVTRFEGDIILDWEYSPCFPNIRAKVPRWEKTQFRYMNIEGDILVDKLEGFTSRVFQHFLDQIGGYTIINPQVSFGNVEIVPGTEKWHGEEVCDAVEYYANFAKNQFKDKPFKMRKFEDINHQLSSDNLAKSQQEMKAKKREATQSQMPNNKEAILPINVDFIKETNILLEELEFFYDDLLDYHEENTKIKNFNEQKDIKDDSVEVFKSLIVNQ